MSDDGLSHAQLIGIITGIIGIIAAGLGYYVKSVKADIDRRLQMVTEIFFKDHVHLDRFDALEGKVDVLTREVYEVKSLATDASRRAGR